MGFSGTKLNIRNMSTFPRIVFVMCDITNKFYANKVYLGESKKKISILTNLTLKNNFQFSSLSVL